MFIPPNAENKLDSDAHEKESDSTIEKIPGKPTGYSTIVESRSASLVACELLKRQYHGWRIEFLILEMKLGAENPLFLPAPVFL